MGDESGERVAEVFAFDERPMPQDGFYPNAAARLGDTFVFRDQTKQQVVFYPVAFNPATGQIIVYTRIRVRINYGDSPLARAGKRVKPAPWKPPAAGPVRRHLGLRADGRRLGHIAGAERFYLLADSVHRAVQRGPVERA